MEKKESCWKTEEGELNFDYTSHIWAFISGPRKIFITSWSDTQKGPMTEFVLEDGEKRVSIEILEDKFNEELHSPEQVDETMEKVVELCRIISRIDTKGTIYWMIVSLKACANELRQQFSDQIKDIHTYYGNGRFFSKTRIYL